MQDFDFQFCEFIDHDMCFITYADFCNKCKTIKELYKPLNKYQKRFYKWYLYSNINMTEYLKNIIWEYLNDYDENGFELLRIKRIQEKRKRGK